MRAARVADTKSSHVGEAAGVDAGTTKLGTEANIVSYTVAVAASQAVFVADGEPSPTPRHVAAAAAKPSRKI